MRPAVYLSPEVYAQTYRDAERLAVSRGLDLDALHKRQERAARREGEAPVIDDEFADPVVDAGLRTFDVTIDAHAYVVNAADRPAAAKVARRLHAEAGHASGAVRVRNHGGTT